MHHVFQPQETKRGGVGKDGESAVSKKRKRKERDTMAVVPF